MSQDHEKLIRSLQYRLQRQGMLELDVWLSPLILATNTADAKTLTAIEKLVQYEVPDLLAMQSGIRPTPEELKPWLD